MNKKDKSEFLDSLYGDISFSAPFVGLIGLPVMQRLRQIRLSNIDSISLPGISGISRFEHAIGVGYLATMSSIAHSLSEHERICFLAAALLHDSAISPYGHLVEEAMQYYGENVDHESRWSFILSENEKQIGGIDLQIFCGRESGLRKWAFSVFGKDSESALNLIFQIIKGEGAIGRGIKGEVDLDNIDNVVRAAHHMGIKVDKELPFRIAKSMYLSAYNNKVTFRRTAIDDLKKWLELRRLIYDRFMLSKEDFSGKIMLISATISALKAKVLGKEDWKLTDTAFIERLNSCEEKNVKETVRRWLLGDLWPISKLFWFNGERPSYNALNLFSDLLSQKLNKELLAYAIQDKRTRQIPLTFSDGSTVSIGSKPNSWLLGVGNSKKQVFATRENATIAEFAEKYFKCSLCKDLEDANQLLLFQK